MRRIGLRVLIPAFLLLLFEQTASKRNDCVEYEVKMYDCYGDGWDGPVLYISELTNGIRDKNVYNLSLPLGSSYASEVICLAPGLYKPFACGPGYTSEVFWSVIDSNGMVLTSGGATLSCVGNFSESCSCCTTKDSLHEFVVSTPAPTLTLIPTVAHTNHPSSTPTLSLSPTPASMLGVTSEIELRASIASFVSIELLADVYLTRQLYISGKTGLSLDGHGFKIDGSGSVRCFYFVGANTHVILANLIITNGFVYGEGAGAFIYQATVIMNSCVFSNHIATTQGGGVYIQDGAFVNMTNCKISANIGSMLGKGQGSDGGGGVWIGSSSLMMIDCALSNNTVISSLGDQESASGGGLFSIAATFISLVRCTISNNSASAGGGVFATASSKLTMFSCVVAQNMGSHGGGLDLQSGSMGNFTDCIVVANTAKSGGGVTISSESSIAYFLRTSVIKNHALGSTGGGFFIESGTITIVDSAVMGNVALGSEFELASDSTSTCYVGGGCFFSSSMQGIDYENDAKCVFKTTAAGKLKVVSFSTEKCCDKLVVGKVTYSGDTGPDGLAVQARETLTFTSDSAISLSGFEICYSSISSGGGMYLIGGSIFISNTTVSANNATRYGGGLYIDGANVNIKTGSSLLSNAALLGTSVYFASGTFSASDLKVNGEFSGASVAGANCLSPCAAGEYGDCATASGTSACFVNCICRKCSPGKSSSFIGATSPSVCSSCGSGQVSSKFGATSCVSCPKGQFAAINSSDEGGGLIIQHPMGATHCNLCPGGFFAASKSTLVCQACAAGTTSEKGSFNCSKCSAGKYSSSNSPTCDDCLAGFYAAEAGTPTCTACAAGTFASIPGSALCDECIPGRAQGASGQSVCVECEAGTFSSTYSMTYCSACDGDFYSQEAATYCNSCVKQFYYTLNGECVSCPTGTLCEEDGGSTIQNLILEKNYWRISDLSSIVHKCPIADSCAGGSNFTLFGQGYCRHHFSGILCSKCEFGYYLDAAICSSCGNGFTLKAVLRSPILLMIFISVACVLVLVGLYMLKSVHKLSVSDLRERQETVTRIKHIIQAMILRAFGLNHVLHYILEREFLPNDSIEFHNDGGFTIERSEEIIVPENVNKTCFITNTTLVTTTVEITTLSHDTSIRKITKTKVEPNTKYSKIIFKVKSFRSKLKSLASYFQISANVPFNCGVTFPSSIQRVLTVLSVLNLDILPSFGLSCHFKSYDFISEVMIATISPLIITFILVIYYIFVTKEVRETTFNLKEVLLTIPTELREKFTSKELHSMIRVFNRYDVDRNGQISKDEYFLIVSEFAEESIAEDTKSIVEAGTNADALLRSQFDKSFAEADTDNNNTIDIVEFLTAIYKSRLESNRDANFCTVVDRVNLELKRKGQTVFYLILVLTFLVVVNTSRLIFIYFVCNHFPESNDGTYLLVADYSVNCNSNRYKAYRFFVVAQVFVYPLGIPFMYFMLLRQHRDILTNQELLIKEEEDDSPHIGHLVFLTEAYRPEFYYFEAVECIRRVVLGSVIGLASGGASDAAPPLLGVLVCLIFLYSSIYFRPFKDELDNTLSVVLAYSLTLIFLGSIMLVLRTSTGHDSNEVIYDVLMAVVLAAGPLFLVRGFILEFVSSFQYLYSMRAGPKGTSIASNEITPNIEGRSQLSSFPFSHDTSSNVQQTTSDIELKHFPSSYLNDRLASSNQKESQNEMRLGSETRNSEMYGTTEEWLWGCSQESPDHKSAALLWL